MAQVPTPRAVTPTPASTPMPPTDGRVPAAVAAAPSPTPWTFPTAPTQIRALHEQATARVKQIINQPVQTYRRSQQVLVALTQGAWFHEGAQTPDYMNVDVRKTQDNPYTQAPWVASTLNPAVMYKSSDLEFNANLKFYYTDRNVPKKRLTEAEMVEINGLYRIIGKCEEEIKKLLAQTNANLDAAAAQMQSSGAPVFEVGPDGKPSAISPNQPQSNNSTTEDDTETTIITTRIEVPGRGIDPMTGRLLAGGLGVLLLFMIARRLFSKG